ncbi:glycosyl hydrolase family 8 [Aureimonas glaciei]|uniref:Glucanase n=1 Tax=Aureimonas glaciei TaxID=1776957 RepID=A0A916Y8F3_9HYPH|nr:glycosyl hydrolase family 8 [Aureimonas glaciei]GGD34549.1 endoglucanase [Aureimonas glaciei]
MSRLSTLAVSALALLVAVGALLPQPARAAGDSAGRILPSDYVVGSWELYRARFVTAEGRVTDDDNGMISHSEGQGYGMLLAVAADDRRSFEQIWAWTRQELFIRDDGLAAWRWDPKATPHVTDLNDATDGDLLIAWALLRAGSKWLVSDYKAKARGIVDGLAELALADSPYGRGLLPAVTGFDAPSQPDAPVVNLSYWVLPAIAELEVISPKLAKAGLIDSGLQLIKAARFGPEMLPTDWIGFGADGIRPAQNFPRHYGYNAVRIPLYLAWYSDDHADLLAPFADAWRKDGPLVPRVVEVDGGTTINEMVGPGYLALDDLLQCSLQRVEMVAAAKNFEPTTYYPSTLHILSLMALSERYPQCL